MPPEREDRRLREGAHGSDTADPAASDRDPERQEDGDGESEADTPPKSVVDEAQRLSRLAREAVDEAEAEAYRRDRDRIMAEHGYETRITEDDGRAVLACYPSEWMAEGTVQLDVVEDVSRGIERPLEGPGVGDDWEAVAAHNRDLAAQVRADHGDTHGETADALAAFANNHYAKPIEQLTSGELDEFRADFFPRNSWPSDDQKAALDTSIRLTFETADAPVPGEH